MKWVVGGFAIAEWPTHRATTILNAAQILAWLVVGGTVLVTTGHFTYDQAYFYEMSVRVAESLRPAAYGPFVSGLDPAPLTPGGLLYDVYAVPFLFFRDPRAGMAWIHLLVAGGAWMFDRALRRLEAPSALRLAAVTLLTWGLFHARLTSTLWNGGLFLAVSPAMLYVTTRAGLPWRSGLAFGALAALLLQIHVSGGMVIGVCVALLLLRSEGRPNWRFWATAGVVAFAAYVPFAVREVLTGRPDLHLLGSAAPHGLHLSGMAFLQSLLAPTFYASHVEYPAELLPPFHDWSGWVFAWSGWAAAGWVLLGVFARFPLKAAAVLAWAGLPLFFLATARPYYHHYAASLIPLLCLFAAAGVAVALGIRGWPRIGGLVYLLLFVLSGAAVLLAQLRQPVVSPQNPWNGLTVAVQLERTRLLLANAAPVPSQEGDEFALVEAVLAKRVFGKDLDFVVGGRRCRVVLGFRLNTGERRLRVGPDSTFACEGG